MTINDLTYADYRIKIEIPTMNNNGKTTINQKKKGWGYDLTTFYQS